MLLMYRTRAETKAPGRIECASAPHIQVRKKQCKNAPHPPAPCCTFESLFGLCFESLFWGFVLPLSQFRTRSEREKTSDSKLKIQVRTAK
jgi:hypothetical protein